LVRILPTPPRTRGAPSFASERGGTTRQLGVPTNRITEILNRRRAITGDSALRLAHFFGTSAEFWLNLQSLYEIRLAERRSGKSIRALPKLKRFEQVHA
jgi:addiction module HigA family antidote